MAGFCLQNAAGTILEMKRPDNLQPTCLGRRSIISIGLCASLVVLSACGAQGASNPSAVAADRGQIGQPVVAVVSALVDAQRGKQLVDQGAIVVDVRTPAEFAEGHVPGALLIDVSSANFTQEIMQLNPSLAYVVYCRSGNRSAVAISQMLAAGFTELYDMGPLNAWAQAGYPVVTN
jgi:rhodanese-related sulfurtransferase